MFFSKKKDPSVYLRYLAKKLLQMRKITASQLFDEDAIQNMFVETAEDIFSVTWMESLAVLKEKKKNASISESIEAFDTSKDISNIVRGVFENMKHKNPFVRMFTIFFLSSLMERAKEEDRQTEAWFVIQSFAFYSFVEEHNADVNLAFLDFFQKTGLEDPHLLSLIYEKGMADPDKNVRNAVKKLMMSTRRKTLASKKSRVLSLIK